MSNTDGNAFDWAAELGTQSADAYAALTDYNSFENADLSGYENPYTDMVVDATLSDIDRTRQSALSDNAADAAAANAYGGGRHGVVDSLTNEAALRQSYEASAALREAGYNEAADLMQQDIDNAYNAYTAQAEGYSDLANSSFLAGDYLLNAQEEQGDKAQSMEQELYDLAADIFEGNDPYNILGQLQDALGDSALTGNATTDTSSTTSASQAEELGAAFATVGEIIGGGK